MKPSLLSTGTTTAARSVLVAVLAVATTALGACGSNETPPAGPTSAAAPSATASSAPASSITPSAAPSSATPSAAPSSSASTAPDNAKIEKVSTDFVKKALTLGYPDKTVDAYLDRIKPLMTEDGYAKVTEAFPDTAKGNKQAGQLYDQRVRGIVQITSPVKVTSTTGEKATASVSFIQKRQQQRSGTWKTLETKPETTSKVSLERAGGKWLVNSVE